MVELSAIATMKLYLPGVALALGIRGRSIFPIRTRSLVRAAGNSLPATSWGVAGGRTGVMKGYWNDPRGSTGHGRQVAAHRGRSSQGPLGAGSTTSIARRTSSSVEGFSVFSMEGGAEFLNPSAACVRRRWWVPIPPRVAPVAVVCLRQDPAPGEEVPGGRALKWCLGQHRPLPVACQDPHRVARTDTLQGWP